MSDSSFDKNASAFLSNGRASKGHFKSCTDGMFDNLGGNDDNNKYTWTSETTYMGPHDKTNFNFDINFSGDYGNQECTTGWNMKNTNQMNGLTMQSSYNHTTGKMSGFIDWGEIWNGVNLFTGTNFSSQSTDFTHTTGFSMTGDQFGFPWGAVGEFTEDQNQNRAYQESSWATWGNLNVGSNVAMNLTGGIRFTKCNLMANVDVNDDMDVSISHESSGLGRGDLSVSATYTGLPDMTVGFNMGLDAQNQTSFQAGVNCDSMDTNVAMDNNMNMSVTHSTNYGDNDNVSMENWFRFPLRDMMGANMGSWMNMMTAGTTFTVNE